ncbi:cyclin-like protein [Lasiosphaeria miniovina]|uniref:Cyclin-like protein n=1 Tax=Lasiosphaeria miniovina TaxID=1954250 RepID=A0AA40DHQ5_9PEZI|nr:cyclin-like protein [Lasiosphaeria miniovina]KAK0701781.1 cyclin-like protein [Lasiosphaeria miniovina]
MSHMTNTLATPEQLYQRRSYSSLPPDLQDAILFATQCLTQAAGVLLQLPQSVTAQANVVLARYWLVEPLMGYEFSDVSAASVFLVAKLGPTPRSPRDIANVYAYLRSSSSTLFRSPAAPSPSPPPANNPNSYYLSETAYQAAHSRILAIEERLLYALGFDTHVSLPYPLAITYLKTMDFLGLRVETVARRVVEYLNTALLSPQMLYLTCQPNELAVAAIYNAARDIGAKMPECEWWEVFDVDREVLGFLVVGMRSVEGWAAKMRDDIPAMAKRMITRKDIEDDMACRGQPLGRNGYGADASVPDLEADMARQMDDQIAELEKSSHGFA